jgi:putative flippase GtrA
MPGTGGASPERESSLVGSLLARAGSSARELRFVLAGGTVACVYLTSTSLLAFVGVPFQVALIVGSVVALSLHFTLQRLFVWPAESDFALPFRHQIGRYLLLTGVQYALTAASTAILPSALGLATEVVYLATVALTVTANYLVFRQLIFHSSETD